MFNAVFNTTVRHDLDHTLVPEGFNPKTQPQWTDTFLIPIQVLFNGHVVTVFQNNVVDDDVLCVKTWIKAALVIGVIAPPIISGSIIAAIPLIYFSTTTIIGIALRTFALYSSEKEWKTRNTIAEFYESKIKFDKKMPLAVSQRILQGKRAELISKMTSTAIWTNPLFIQEVDDYLRVAAIAMEQFFEDLEKLSENDVKKMATWLSTPKVERESLRSLKNAEMIEYPNKQLLERGWALKSEEINPLTYHFFMGSFFEMYHMVRQHITWPFGSTFKPLLNDEDQVIYFKPGTPQYQWRMTFNSLSSRFEHYKKGSLSLRQILIKENKPIGIHIGKWTAQDDRYLNEQELGNFLNWSLLKKEDINV